MKSDTKRPRHGANWANAFTKKPPIENLDRTVGVIETIIKRLPASSSARCANRLFLYEHGRAGDGSPLGAVPNRAEFLCGTLDWGRFFPHCLIKKVGRAPTRSAARLFSIHFEAAPATTVVASA